MWKNMAAWCEEEGGWVDLPGPADWWPEDSEIDRTGFAFSDRRSGHYEAYRLIHADQEPSDGTYERVLPSGTDLVVMEDSIETREILKAFFRF
jgi:hypothetical protein